MVAITTYPAFLPLVTAGISLTGIMLLWWGVFSPRLPLALLGFSLVTGQALRIPLLGQGGGLLPSDLAVVLTILAALVIWLYKRPAMSARSNAFLFLWVGLVSAFVMWSGISLLAGYQSLSLATSAMAIASLYWIRLIMHLLLLPALIVLSSKYHCFSRHFFIFTAGLLIVLGGFQFLVLSDFSELTAQGWDPHNRRLTSTWLDPNYFAAYLFIATPLAMYYTSKRSTKLLLAVLGFGSLILTQSRSGVLAFAIAAFAAAPLYFLTLKTKEHTRAHLLVAFTALASLSIIAAAILWPRFVSLLTEDPTARLRQEALTAAQERLLPLHGYVGSGYNTYQFAAEGVGLSSSSLQHSRAGADNSWLTIWITTGLPGLLMFTSLWLALAVALLRNFFTTRQLPPILVLGGLIGLIFHSQVVNSLLYSHLLITILWAAALALTTHHEKSVRHVE